MHQLGDNVVARDVQRCQVVEMAVDDKIHFCPPSRFGNPLVSSFLAVKVEKVFGEGAKIQQRGLIQVATRRVE